MKNKIIFAVVLVWMVFSISYIAYDVWSDFKASQMVAAYNQGKADTISALISAAENSCDVIPVSSASKQIGVVNSSCVSSVNSGK
jgi:hypothetical protein